MSVLCPYCSLVIELKGARPGRFSPRCPRCKEKFILLVPRDGEGHPEAMSLREASESAAGSPAITLADPESPPSAPSPPPSSPASPPSSAPVETIPELPATPSQPSSRSDTSAYFAAKRGRYADWDDDNGGQAAQSAAAVAPPPGESPPVADEQPIIPDADIQPAKAAFTGPTLKGTLGGYEIRRKLGHGGMGAVYLAKQLSLDRDVALKVLLPQYASDPQFVARFTREAFAAAQLTHHNVVQIHDIGADDDTHYFSMEYVEGRNLAEVIRDEGRQDPDVAVGYILHAARGLKFAHDHGMIHRDIKPDNLLLNRHGIVKVADLGLVKTPATAQTQAGEAGGAARTAAPGRSRSGSRSEVTEASAVFGTPAFMAPEQCADSTSVDQRADIYSLGCTLYDLLTGRPPFWGETALEVMTKQVKEQAVPPEVLSRHVPGELSRIVQKMMAKRPEDRYQDLGELIVDLEEYLGIHSAGPFTPREEHVRTLEAAVDQYYESSAPKLRSQLIAGFFTACTLGVIFAAVVGSLRWASGFVGLGAMTSCAYFVISGLADKTYLFQKVRQMAFAAPMGEWVKAILGLALVGVAIVVLGWGWIWLGFAVLAVLLAVGFSATMDASVRRSREMPLRRVEELLRSMRLKGLEESAIRQFVCKYAGERWEEFFENLFGYEAKMEARRQWGGGDRGRRRRRFRAWRDPIIRWVDEHESEKKRERDRIHLQGVEVRSLEAQGVDMLEARRRAKQRAERMLEHAEMLRESSMRQAVTVGPDAAASPAPPSAKLVKAMLNDEDVPPEGRAFKREHHMYITRRYGGPLDILLGSTVRFVAAALILTGFLAWRYQNKDWERITRPTGEVATAAREDVVETVGRGATEVISILREAGGVQSAQKQLQLPMVPEWIEMLLSSWGAGVAGLILLLSIFFRGNVFGLMVLAAAGVAILGPYFTLSDLDPLAQEQIAAALQQTEGMIRQANLTANTLSMAIAAAMFVVAVVFLRDKEPG